MANIKITDLTAYTDAASTDVLPIVDVGADVTKKITIGNVVKAVPLGTAALPGLAFDGDPNSGVYSPGADQVAISTNGTGALFVDASGNVGVGQSGGARGGAGTRFLSKLASGQSFIEVQANGTADANALIFSDGSTGNYGAYGYDHSNDSAYIQTAGQTRLTIDSSGRVGLGTSSPQSILHLNSGVRGVPESSGATTTVTSLRIRGSSNGVLDIGELSSATAGSYWIQVRDQTDLSYAYDLSLQPNGGNVGIGTSSPSHTLSVNGSISSLTGVIRAEQGANAGYIVGSRSSQTDFQIYNTGNVLRIYNGSTDALNVDSSGNVGIGTTDVGSYSTYGNKLVIYGTGTNGPGMTIATGASDTGSIYFADGTTGNEIARGAVQYSHADDALLFQTAASERARIDSSGRLLVGTSSTSINLRALIQATSANGAGSGNLYLARGEATPADGAALGYVGFSDSNHASAAGIEAARDGGTWTSGASQPSRLMFSTCASGSSSPTERMRIASGGRVSAPSWYDETTAGAANVNVASTGILQRSTSSIKYKTNVETIEDSYSDALLNCRPVWYRSTCANDNPNYGWWGFIAEEVAEIDPRLCFFEQKEDGNLEPEGVAYDRFVPHLLNLIKRQGEAIAELQAEVAALKGA